MKLSGWRENIRLNEGEKDALNPSIAVQGNKLYVVWKDWRNGKGEIYFKRSLDSGNTWESEIKLADTNESDISWLRSPIVNTDNNGNIHLVWDKKISNGNDAIFYKKSTDFGMNWSPEIRLSDENKDSLCPNMVIAERNIHIGWFEDENEIKICYRRSQDGGNTWGTMRYLVENVSSNRNAFQLSQEKIEILDYGFPYLPSEEIGILEHGSPYIHSFDLGVEGENLYLIWGQGSLREKIYFMKSVDSGNTWGSPIEIGGTGSSTTFLDPIGIASKDNIIYVVWSDSGYGESDKRQKVYCIRSIDGGNNWQSKVRLSKDNANCVDITKGGGWIHVVWSQDKDGDCRRIYYRKTQDGIKWEDALRLSYEDGAQFFPYITADNFKTYLGWINLYDKTYSVYYKSGLIDPTPPTIPMVIDEGKFTSSTTQLHIQCASSDPETGIAEYQCCVGTYDGKNNLLDWKSGGTSTDFVITGLNLNQGGTYYVGVKARNPGGLWSEPNWSDGIEVDTTPPSEVKVKGKYANNQISTEWLSSDLESGVRYYYCLGTTRGGTDTIDWKEAGLSSGITLSGLSLEEGKTYYFTIKAVNGAGLCSIGYSDGIAIDPIPPTITNPKATPDTVSPGQSVKLEAYVVDDISGIGSVTIDLSSI
ncbi:MAG: exo-alpha-sialidase, partial [bacterium]